MRCPSPGCPSELSPPHPLCFFCRARLPPHLRERLSLAVGREERTDALAVACYWLTRRAGEPEEGRAGSGAESEPAG
jgi:hypothetical protein